jgi:hypothetical protein
VESSNVNINDLKKSISQYIDKKSQQRDDDDEGIDFEETFSLVERLEEIKMFLGFAFFRNFKNYQMDVKSKFLNGTLE